MPRKRQQSGHKSDTQSPGHDVVRERERQTLLTELDEEHALDLGRLRKDVSRNELRNAIVDTIITYRRARRGTLRSPRYPKGLVPAINLLLRTVNPMKRGESSNPYKAWDTRLRILLLGYRERVTYGRRLRRQLKNVLIVTLAGVLRAVMERRQRVNTYLPFILQAAKVLPGLGNEWSPEALERRIDRLGGASITDLAALVPLSHHPDLRPFRESFVMFETDKKMCLIFLEKHLSAIPSFPPEVRDRVDPETANQNLLHERWPIPSPSFAGSGVPYLTCHKS